MALYDDLPAFRAVMNREGVLRAGELAVIGDEGSVRQQLRAYTDTGATEFILVPLDPEAARLHRLWILAASKMRSTAWVASKRHRFPRSWDGFAPFDQLSEVIVVFVICGDRQAQAGAQP